MQESTNKESSLFSITCYKNKTKKQIIGTGSVDIEEDLKGHLLKIADMLNIALVVSNVPENIGMKEIDKYRRLIDLIHSGYEKMTGEKIKIEKLLTKMRSIVFPRAESIPVEQLSEHYRTEILALKKAA